MGTRRKFQKGKRRAGSLDPLVESNPDRVSLQHVVEGDGEPLVARFHHPSAVFDKSLRTPSLCAAWLSKASKDAGAAGAHSLIAGGGFGDLILDDPLRRQKPSTEEFDRCIDAAVLWLEEFKNEMSGPLASDLFFGLDVLAIGRYSRGPKRVAQFGVWMNREGGIPRIVSSKRLPNSDEESYVYPWGERHSIPFTVETSLGRTLVLVCHDTTAFFPRGMAATKRDFRKERRGAVQKDITDSKLDIALSLIHNLPSEKTFVTSLKFSAKANPRLKMVGAFGYGSSVDRLHCLNMASKLRIPLELSVVEIYCQPWI